MMTRRAYFVVELLLWFTAPLVFLAIYVSRYHYPPVVILEHLYPIALIAAFGMLMRQILQRLIPWRALAQAVNTGFYVSVLSVLIAYYALVLSGLKSWGKVISEELIGAYAEQARGLCESMGLSFHGVLAAGLCAWVILAGLHFAFSRRFEPVKSIGTTRYPQSLITVLLVCAAPFPLHRLWDYQIMAHGASQEPFYLSLHIGKLPAGGVDPTIVYNDTFSVQEKEARQQYRVDPHAQHRNVVLIVADALRADHLAAYGYGRPTSPWLQQQVALGHLQRYDNVHSVCSESNCAMAGLLASRYVPQLPSDPFTLPQVLKLHGYKIVMILGGDQTNYYNKRSLFGKVDEYYDGSMATGYYMNDDSFVAERTKQLAEWNGKPTMLQFHLMSSHLLGKRLDPFLRWTPVKSYGGKTMGQPEARYTNFYDNGVLQYDDFVRQILETLRAKKYLDNAIVIVTSDHGDSLGDRGVFSHTKNVHEALMHIPLLMSGLGEVPTSQTVKPFISQSDIAPTVLNELGMAVPTTWVGTPMHATLEAGKNSDLIYFKQFEYAGVYDGRESGKLWKYWLNNSSKEEFVYRLDRDPDEKANFLWQAPPELLEQWRKRVVPTLAK
ncbi:LTA synthase family protein [Massilia sp. TSP1-1-2]|uniref:LTA synthase family protein n=1 Tax=Massilia sp. TSP1-1-2 TaxID=2804649 RepID=UPI003CED9B76